MVYLYNEEGRHGITQGGGPAGTVRGCRRQWGKGKMGTERRRIILATVGVFIVLSAIFVISAGNSFKATSKNPVFANNTSQRTLVLQGFPK